MVQTSVSASVPLVFRLVREDRHGDILLSVYSSAREELLLAQDALAPRNAVFI